MTLRLTDEQDRRLTELAAERGISKHELVIRAIDHEIARKREVRAQVLGRIVTEDAELLDLLAQ